jgi:hypothetical protein
MSLLEEILFVGMAALLSHIGFKTLAFRRHLEDFAMRGKMEAWKIIAPAPKAF